MYVYIYRYKYILQLAEPSLFEHIQYTTVIFLKKKGHTSRNPSSSRATPLSKNKSTSYHSKTSILHPTFQLFYARLFNIKPTSNQHTQPTYWTQLQSHSPPIQTNPKIGTSTGGGTFGGSGARSNVFGLMGKKHMVRLWPFLWVGVPCLYEPRKKQWPDTFHEILLV